MATGNIENPMGIESFTPQLSSGFTLASWGWINAWRIGNLAIVAVHGMYSSTSISSDTACMTIPYTVPGNITTFGKCGSGIMNVLSVYDSSNTYIKVNNVINNTGCYFTFITPVTGKR